MSVWMRNWTTGSQPPGADNDCLEVNGTNLTNYSCTYNPPISPSTCPSMVFSIVISAVYQ